MSQKQSTNEMFSGLVRDLTRLDPRAYRQLYTELSERVCLEGTNMPPEMMHFSIMSAANQGTQ